MRNFIFSICFLVFVSNIFAQTGKKITLTKVNSKTPSVKKANIPVTSKQPIPKKHVCVDEKKPLNYTISITDIDSTLTKSQTKLVIKFLGPSGKPVRNNMKFTMNGDSVFPVIGSYDTYDTFVLPKKYKFQFLASSWENIITDSISFKKNKEVYITVRFEAKEITFPKVLYGLDKPVIYLYPEKPTKVNLTLDVKGSMVFSYPKYENGWDFVANPSGNIVCWNKNYGYLFWEGAMQMTNLPINWNEGFAVKSDTLINFFEHSLANAGLNEKEAQDFITYWVPKMQLNEYNFIHFMFNKEYDYFATININPPPKNLIRVFVLWSQFQNINEKIAPQIFPKFDRSGFTVIEWGGSEIDNTLRHLK